MFPTKGRFIHTLGKKSSIKQLCSSTVFIDHASNYIFNNYQVNLTAATTMESNYKCESKFDEFGILIQQYAPNNHPFHSYGLS